MCGTILHVVLAELIKDQHYCVEVLLFVRSTKNEFSRPCRPCVYLCASVNLYLIYNIGEIGKVTWEKQSMFFTNEQINERINELKEKGWGELIVKIQDHEVVILHKVETEKCK